jgi:uncharacterized membrane protein YkgB
MDQYKDLFLQFPLVAIFVVFTLIILDKFLRYIAAQRTEFLAALDKYAARLELISVALQKLTDEIEHKPKSTSR